MTTLLALDTATEACSVALSHGGEIVSRYEVIPRKHAQRVLPMVQEVLAEAGISLAAVDAIAFGRGPGAFTGVRIAVGVVQGLAFGIERPVLPISNLAVIAQRALREHGVRQVAVAIDARMDEVYWGCYRADADDMRLLGNEGVMVPERAQLPLDAQGDWFGAGTGWTYAARLPVRPVAMDAGLLPHAVDMISLASVAWGQGLALPADAAQPVYLRDNVATPKAR